jgi:hypothetical protein
MACLIHRAVTVSPEQYKPRMSIVHRVSDQRMKPD